MNENETLFKNAPVHKAVFQMAIPTVISSLVLIIYKKKQGRSFELMEGID